MVYSIDLAHGIQLEEEGVGAGSIWRCLRPSGETFAMLEVLGTDSGRLSLKVYAGETGLWGNSLPEVRELHRLEPAEFVSRKNEGTLVRVN
ncbi:MAG TPA: hypothetical protein VFJ84_03730 [Candidatus Saccharimonadales bacterium]|nr:hypothetical protein [Candidatus Saccharimonadales bacterium]